MKTDTILWDEAMKGVVVRHMWSTKGYRIHLGQKIIVVTNDHRKTDSHLKHVYQFFPPFTYSNTITNIRSHSHNKYVASFLTTYPKLQSSLQ